MTDPAAPVADGAQPPQPRHEPHYRTHHGDAFIDNFEWMRDKTSPEVIDHLHAENGYTDTRTAHLSGLRDTIVSEIKSRTKESDPTVPVLENGWWYFSRSHEGKQYRTIHRVADTGQRPDATDQIDGEQLLIDGNAAAEGREFYVLTDVEPAPDAQHLAFSVDYSGDERYDLVIIDMNTGDVVDDAVTGVVYGTVWSADSQHIFYTRADDAWRSHQIWRHQIGTGAEDDHLVFQEDDKSYWASLDISRDYRWITITTASKSSTEVRLYKADDVDAEPIVVHPRTSKLEYHVEPAGDELLIVHNLTNRDFTLSTAPIAPTAPRDWTTVLDAADGERILDVDAFANYAVVSLRTDGMPSLRILSRAGGGFTDPIDVPRPSELASLNLGSVPEWDSDEILVYSQSYIQPATVSSYRVATGTLDIIRQTPVPNYDQSQYVEKREWVTASDGTEIPVSIVHKQGVSPDGTNPGLLYGYGSYEISIDSHFALSRFSLLDRGVVFALAHIRGGGEMGRKWYEEGRLDHKINTFTDFIAAGEYLVNTGWVAPGRLAAEGRSAGGLLMGAVTNMAPNLFRAVHAGVPFVDALTTILQPELPLTVGEWEEWGNPLENSEVYEYMKRYSPYDNVAAHHYPAILATTSLNDVRVFFVEPAKWIARLREETLSPPETHPVLFRCEMVAGHGGKSGRYNAWAERAFEVAFLLDQIGAAD